MKNVLFLTILVLFLTGCGSAKQLDCLDGCSKYGTNGINGKDGLDGQKGEKGDTGVKGETGSSGVQGLNGTNGTNGANLVSKVFQANNTLCKAGGVTVYLFTDLNNDNEYQNTDSNLNSFTLCNGTEKHDNRVDKEEKENNGKKEE